VLKSQLGQLDPSIPWVRDAHDDYQQVQRNSMRALAMRKTRTVEPTFQYSTSQTPMGTPQHSITMHAGDQPVGHITLLEKPDHFQVDDVEVNKDLRGKGYGNALYRQALDYAGQAGKPELRSGQTPSEDAQKVWQSLGAQPFTENYASPESGDYSLQRYRLAGAEGLPPARPVKPFKIQDPSLISQLMSHIVGKPVDVSRLDWNGYGTFENQLSPNLRIPLTGRTSQGKWANLSTKQRQTFLSILGQDLNQDAMAASHFATVPHGEGDTHSVFVNRYDGEVNQPAIARFSQAVGLPLNVTQHPNGTVIDLNTPPGFAKPDVERVRSLAEETFGDDPNVHDIGIISRKYKSDYIKRNQYERIIGKQTPAPSQGAPDIAPGVGGVRPADGDPGGLAGIRASLQRIAAQQDLEMGKWHQTYSTRLENHLSQEAARLAKQQALQAKQAARQQKRGLFSPPPPESPPVP
jgi:GNAT superfamily N-acetyltransferase